MKVEVDVVDRAALTVSIDEEQPRAADALNGWNVELTSAFLDFDIGRSKADRPLMRGGGVLHSKCHRAGAGPVRPGIFFRVAPRFGIDDEVAVALLVQCDVLGLVMGNLREAHA